MDVGANGAFGLASTMGALAITATLSSLYPIVTAVLARIVLEQRMRRIQLIGVVCVMAGVVLLTI
jgi:drug/metabolite transporter (DMT)-like permease